MKIIRKSLVACLVLGTSLSAFAETKANETKATETKPTETKANETTPPGNFMIRLRGVEVLPRVSHNKIRPIGGKAKVKSNYVPEIDFTYFFNQCFAVELIAAVTKHRVRAAGTAVGNVHAGHAWLLPPTLTFQYHINCSKDIKPYIGAGVNYTFFYDKKPGDLQDVHYKDNFAFAMQAGFDIHVCGGWYLNMDVKKIFVKTKVSFNDHTITTHPHLNPLLLGVGIGYRFSL